MDMRDRHPPDPSDRELLRAVRDDHEEWAFRLLYRRYTPRLCLFAVRTMGGDVPGAEDVVQETWIVACRRLATFRGDAALSTWLTSICLNLCRNVLQKRNRWQETDWGEARETDAATDAAWMTSPEADVPTQIDLERAIERLPAGCRLILLLYDIEGWKHREIATTLEISEGTSKSQLFLARRQLRDSLRPSTGVSHEQA